MRGQLKFIILKQIEQAKCSGYDLMKAIEEKLGQKPSPGSVYPLLDELTHHSLIRKHAQGRKILYDLTAAGKQEIKRLVKTKDELFRGMERSIKLCGMLYGEDVTEKLKAIKELNKDQNPFANPLIGIQKEVEELKGEIFRLFKEKKIQKNMKKVKSILMKAAKDLKKIT